MKIEEMLARETIRYTIGRYSSVIDRSAYPELVDVFTPDSVFKIGARPPFEGRGPKESSRGQRGIADQSSILLNPARRERFTELRAMQKAAPICRRN